jgi:ABC-type antimicrobial peptide transport system ATPase subunit
VSDTRPLLEVTDLVKHYAVRGGILRRQVGTVHAVDGVSFSLGAGETSALSANPAAANRRSPAPCCGWWSRPRQHQA